MKSAVIKKYNLDYSKVKTVHHNDMFTFKMDGCKVKKTDEGYLIGEAPVAKVGVMTYLMADGSVVREFVPPETLFDSESMSSFKMKPMTDDHPYDKKVNADNAYYRSIGMTGETVKQDGDYLVCSMTIIDGSVVSKVYDGKQELSPGYTCELVMQKGDWNGIEYDAIQLSRKYNHLAVVDNARGGTDIRMKLDKCDGFEVVTEHKFKENSMKFNIDGIDYEAAPEVVNFIKKLNDKVDSAETSVKNTAKENEGLKAERDTLKTKVDTLEKRDIKSEVQAAVKGRLSLERTVCDALGEVENIDSLTDRDLKVKLITEKMPAMAEKCDAKATDDYVNTAFDIVVAGLTKESNDSQKEIAGAPAKKVEKTDSAARRQAMIDELLNPKKN